jgi:hypothetical protein
VAPSHPLGGARLELPDHRLGDCDQISASSTSRQLYFAAE